MSAFNYICFYDAISCFWRISASISWFSGTALLGDPCPKALSGTEVILPKAPVTVEMAF